MSLASVADMAESMIFAKEGRKSVTLGIKVAGFKRFDVKTTLSTIIDKDNNREPFNSCFYKNDSHEEVKAAETIKPRHC